VVSSLPLSLGPFHLEFSLLRLFLPRIRTPVPGGLGATRRLGSGSCVHSLLLSLSSLPPRPRPCPRPPLALSLAFSFASIPVLSVRSSFLPPARERSSPSGSKSKNLRKTLLARLDISRLRFHDHEDLRRPRSMHYSLT
jgi:hypothetical protein